MRQNAKVLVFTACYNERSNIGPLVEQIFRFAPDVDVLVVDDSSPDGTWDAIVELQTRYPRLFGVKRPGKRGIGSAHKYALYYAMREGYDYVLTMDADFSHNPASIPALLAAAGPNVFVTGSRYCPGGRSDYSGYRDIVSRLGNIAARNLLNLQISELTTYFRVFDVASLKRLPFRYIHSEGYSYGVQIVYYLRKQGVELREVPIHFVDRLHGTSKIPRLQIITSAVDLLTMWGRRMLRIGRRLTPDRFTADACSCCGDHALAMKFPSGATSKGAQPSLVTYAFTALGGGSNTSMFSCLNCGVEQVPQAAVPRPRYQDLVPAPNLSNVASANGLSRTV